MLLLVVSSSTWLSDMTFMSVIYWQVPVTALGNFSIELSFTMYTYRLAKYRFTDSLAAAPSYRRYDGIMSISVKLHDKTMRTILNLYLTILVIPSGPIYTILLFQ